METRDTEVPTAGEPPKGRQGPGFRPREAKGGQTYARNGGRHRDMTRGADTSGGGWRVAGVGDVQVDGAPRWERR